MDRTQPVQLQILCVCVLTLAAAARGQAAERVPVAIAATSTPVIAAGGKAILDGSGSSDADSDISKFLWTLTSKTNPGQPPVVVPTSNRMVEVILTEPGEYDAALVVTDDDCEEKTSDDTSDSHVTIKVVKVLFNPTGVTLAAGASAPVVATVVPEGAVGDVAFSMEHTAVGTLDKSKLITSPGTLTVTGVAEGQTTLRAEITAGLGSITVGSAPITVTAAFHVAFKYYGRQVVFDSGSTGSLLSKGADFIIEIVQPTGAVFDPVPSNAWNSNSGSIVLSGISGSLPPNRIGVRVRGGAVGGPAEVSVRATVRSGDLTRTVTLSKPFGAIQLIAQPHKPNPPHAWFPPGPEQAPGDETRLFAVASVPSEPLIAFANLGLTSVRHLWTADSETFEVAGGVDARQVTVRALKVSRSATSPDLARYGLLLKGVRLEGGEYSGDETAGVSNSFVRGRLDLPVLVNGCELTVTPPPPICVGESITILCAVRAGDGRGSVDKPTLANNPVVIGETMTVATKNLFLDTEGVGADGAALLKLGYESPSHPGFVCFADAALTVLPVDSLEIGGGNSFCFDDPPAQLTTQAFCGAKEVPGPKIHWKMLNDGGTGSTIHPNTGVFTPGPRPGRVEIQASILAADKPQYVLADLLVPKVITIDDLGVIIPEAQGRNSITFCFPTSLSAKVFCGPHEITGDPGVSVTWPNGGPIISTPGVHMNILARARFRGRTSESPKLTVSIIDDTPPHEPGDFSVDKKDEDVTESKKPWVATRYYYSGVFHEERQFQIGVDRFIPGIDEEGRPTEVSIRNRVISPKAKLRLWVHGGSAPQVSVNGASYTNGQKLRGSAGGGVYEFEIKSTDLLLPFQGILLFDDAVVISSERPVARANQILVLSDVCAYELSFTAMSPYIMVHGKGADGKYWDGTNPGGVNCWDGMTMAFKAHGIPFDNHIKLRSSEDEFHGLPSQGAISDQAEQIDEQISLILKSFGTQHVNLIAHSKGGLDSRFWLTNIKPKSDFTRNLIVGQFITINTPHLGSVIGDYAFGSTELDSWGLLDIAIQGALLKYPFLLLGGIVSPQEAGSPATAALRTASMQIFNRTNVDALENYKNEDATEPVFICTASDADLKPTDNQISLPADYAGGAQAAIAALSIFPPLEGITQAIIADLNIDLGPPYSPNNGIFVPPPLKGPDETQFGIKWDGLVGLFVTGTIGSRTAYHALREIKEVRFRPGPLIGTSITEVSRDSNKLQPNDFLVTRSSGLFEYGAPTRFITFKDLYFHGKEAKMHGNVGGKEVGEELIRNKRVIAHFK